MHPSSFILYIFAGPEHQVDQLQQEPGRDEGIHRLGQEEPQPDHQSRNSYCLCRYNNLSLYLFIYPYIYIHKVYLF